MAEQCSSSLEHSLIHDSCGSPGTSNPIKAHQVLSRYLRSMLQLLRSAHPLTTLFLARRTLRLPAYIDWLASCTHAARSAVQSIETLNDTHTSDAERQPAWNRTGPPKMVDAVLPMKQSQLARSNCSSSGSSIMAVTITVPSLHLRNMQLSTAAAIRTAGLKPTDPSTTARTEGPTSARTLANGTAQCTCF